ncbi:MAG: NHL repeat-containing protein [Spirochaetaceae bacterium]|nr:NHL repeat-containing protein [Spirochaetaceae bacterium]MCF7947318.1 NHL repeat-containing protein [Spirochaetia bacterium]MCF7950544.1 NHL repeat-containing protein [Spirochaetaceae bacterium]
MRKIIVSLIVCGVIAGLVGCVSGPPAYDSMPEDLGVVAPVVMFGEPAEGTHDSATYQFGPPKPISVNSKGDILVGSETFDLSAFTSEGEFISLIGSRGQGRGQWMYPKGIDVDKDDNIYVSDNALFKVLIFDANYNLVDEFGTQGEGPGEFEDIGDIAVDDAGSIYVSDDGRGIHVFDPDYNYVKTIMDKNETEENGYIVVNSKLNKLYVSEDGLGEVDVYDTETGSYLYSFGGLGPGPDKLAEDVEGLAVGAWDLVFVVDEGRVAIKIFQEDGTFVTQFGKAGIYEGEMASSEGIAYDAKNKRIVLADEKNNRIQSFALKDLGF